ncbi:DUF2630 family protein [Arthrobacter crystallopoietes]|uniref:DUF2630 domain-containing protein n=1 Tax=Crystallibacter crystallopoietes TaxID=37928 RepID=A0A1H1CKN8_9MICC|nr:DUF2630 family protein [Arthrobacter crystallopoietes]AUI50697.1 hypothetical protein AC20117_07545 [Arthrobacter crystallopoietes]SDQ64639.1 Protein of unknown function [Arthrobacter crystallopoietes]
MDQEIHRRIEELIEEEQLLREGGTVDNEQAEARARELARLEEQLDQCWDLLRQRRAKRRAGEDPDEAQARPVEEVEGYRQ